MAIYAIGDLHLSHAHSKAMDIFGSHWENHFERIRADWKERVTEEDIVLLPGDFSWATHLKDALPDIQAVGALPGRKILIRGNHDYWWSAPAKVRRVLPENMHIIQNDALCVGDTVFCGTRGWVFPTSSPEMTPDDRKIFEREKIRLRLSLDFARRLGGKRLIVLMHYPPLYETWPHTDFTDILEEYGPERVVFGHLHGEILEQIHLADYVVNNIRYHLVSADYLDFRLFELA